jgi:hypothetical protein
MQSMRDVVGRGRTAFVHTDFVPCRVLPTLAADRDPVKGEGR